MFLSSTSGGHWIRVFDLSEHFLRADARWSVFDVWESSEHGELRTEAGCGSEEEEEESAEEGD